MAFQTFNLSMNLGAGIGEFGKLSECNPGGSTICWTPTRGCAAAGMTCVGTSTSFTASEVQVSLPADELESLQKELTEVVQRFVARTG